MLRMRQLFFKCCTLNPWLNEAAVVGAGKSRWLFTNSRSRSAWRARARSVARRRSAASQQWPVNCEKFEIGIRFHAWCTCSRPLRDYESFVRFVKYPLIKYLYGGSIMFWILKLIYSIEYGVLFWIGSVCSDRFIIVITIESDVPLKTLIVKMVCNFRLLNQFNSKLIK